MKVGRKNRNYLSGLPRSAALVLALTLFTVPAILTNNASAIQQSSFFLLGHSTKTDAAHHAYRGAQEAAEEIGVNLLFGSPAEESMESTLTLFEKMVEDDIDAMLLSGHDADALGPSLQKAIDKGIKIVTFDQDAEPDNRHLHIASATNQLIALGPAKIVNELIDRSGDVAVLGGNQNSPTQKEWVAEFIRLTKEGSEFSGISVVDTAYGGNDMDKSYTEASNLVKNNPQIKAIVAYTPVGIVAASKMVTDQKLIGKVVVTGLGYPSQMIKHVESGASPSFSIWNMNNVGYSAVQATRALLIGKTSGAPGDIIKAGRMGYIIVETNATAVIGEMFVYNSQNIHAGAESANRIIR